MGKTPVHMRREIGIKQMLLGPNHVEVEEGPSKLSKTIRQINRIVAEGIGNRGAYKNSESLIFRR